MQRKDHHQAPAVGELVRASDWQQARLHFHRQKLATLGYMVGTKLQQQGSNSLSDCH